jgi:transcription initiation factor TFIID subunit 5
VQDHLSLTSFLSAFFFFFSSLTTSKHVNQSKPLCVFLTGQAPSILAREVASNIARAENPSVLFTTMMNTQGGLSAAMMTPDGTMIAGAFGDHAVRLWHSHSSGGGDNQSDNVIELRSHTKPVYSLSWSPDQRNLLTAGGDGDVRLWDVKLKYCLGCFKGHSGPVWSVDFCPLGHYFLSGSMDHTARLWAMDQSQPLRIFVGHYSDVTCVKFHPNSCYAITGSCDKTARLWDMESGNCLRVLAGHEGTISAIAVTPCGRYIATASEDSTCRIWDIESGQEVALLKGHSGTVHCLDFSVDGSVLASGGVDATVRLWQITKAFEDATSRALTHCTIAPSATFRTKNTPVVFTKWTRRNLLLAGGAFEI